MYTSYIGRRFLTLWNARTGRDLAARQFFDEEIFPLFYNSSKYLQWVPSSPFAQDLNKDEKARVALGANPYEIKLSKLHEKINGTLGPDASFVIGFPAAGVEGTTSGQVSGVGPKVDVDDIYCSWIGGALGVGVSGGLTLLIDQDEVLWTLYEGWARYRTMLSQRDGLKGNQIDTWNGRWLTHAFDPDFNPRQPLAGFNFDKVLDTKDGSSALRTQAWVKVLFALATAYKQRITAYVYSLAQTNRTIGFVPLELGAVEDMHQLSQQLFQLSPDIRDWQKVTSLYETHLGFARACQLGSIGLAAIEPAKLQDYLPGNDKKINLNTDADRFQFDIYQLWILAMLNNQELYNAADRLAATLHDFARRDDHRDSGRGKKNLDRQVEQVFEKKSRPAFIERLADMLAEAGSNAAAFRDAFDEAVRQVMLMPVDNFPLFIILVRFRYIARQSDASIAPASSTQQPTLFNA
ncbi:hypothetical protein [Hymenobacter ruricola]|uniref:Type I-E CRISPR-associated protein Cse1/CasA n=1 Tax=Hymenobacter ruricola TaxID=2791023 RepID=A0ABS0I5H0_9BACT|nr:hypothetical protein [Hymenobacter ruricola]MBF9222195.1 hypothetical protein [Hymenobacter ruricola]